MFDRRALPGTLSGIFGLACALGAMATESRILLLFAALFTVGSVILVLTAPDVPMRYRDRKARQGEHERLAQEADQMAARAARFEAEAINAREQLAAAMRAGVGGGLASGAAGSSDPTAGTRADDSPAASTTTYGRRRTDDPDAPFPPSEGQDRITDTDSGVFNQIFFDASLDKRISAARRGLRPLTVALVEVLANLGTPEEAHADPRAVAKILTATLREADTVARSEDGLFAVLLEDTPENGAIWTLERVRRRITEDIPNTTVRAGMSCYPAYAFDARQIVAQAEGALDAAREWRQDRIEVTTANPDA
jgi:diguanylate cyclase (GGDEF)-like protein